MDFIQIAMRARQAGLPLMLSLRHAVLVRSLAKLFTKAASAQNNQVPPHRNPGPVALVKPAPTPAQVQASYLAAEFVDIDIEPTDEELVDVLMATFGMSRCDVIRRIDQFNYVEVVSAHPMPEAA